MKNTYIQEKKFKNYKFSEGEELTDADLEVIASRSRRTYQTDAAYERFLEEESTYIPVANVVYEEFDNTWDDKFRIGNNRAGGI